MARSAIPTYTTGDLITAAHGNTYWRDNEAYYYALSIAEKERVRVTRTTTQATTSSIAAVTFTAESFDTDSMWTSGAAKRVTFTTAGVYLVSGYAQWHKGTQGNYRIASIRVNGSTIIFANGNAISDDGNASYTPGGLYEFSAADYIELMVQSQENDNLENASLAAIRLD